MAIWTQWKPSTTPSAPAGGLSRLPSDPPTPEAEWPPAYAMRYYDRLAASLATDADAAQNK